MKEFLSNPNSLLIVIGGLISLITSITGISITAVKTHNLKVQNKELRAENQKITAELANTQKLLEIKTAEFYDLKSKLTIQEETLATVKEELKALQTGNTDPLVAKLKEENTRKENTIGELQASLLTIKKELAEIKADKTIGANEAEELKRQITELKEELKEEKAKKISEFLKPFESYIKTKTEAPKNAPELHVEAKVEATNINPETGEAIIE